MTSTYSTSAYINSTIDGTCGPPLSRNFEGKIHFPSLLPITDNLHEWIDQFKNNEPSSSIDNGLISNNSISGLNSSNLSSGLKSREGYNMSSCIHLHSNCSDDDVDGTNYSEKQYKPNNIYNNQYPYLKPQIPSFYYPVSRQLPTGPSAYRSFAKSDDRKLIDFYINPIELNFLPKELWLSQKVTLKSVFQNFFKARSTKNLRFEHKLWNALSLSKRYPELIPFLGVFWVSKNLIKVNRDIFGALINVSKPAAALFNNQGSFLTHGFLEITKEKALMIGIAPELIEDVDESIVRLFKHSAGLLTADSNKADVSTCRWNK